LFLTLCVSSSHASERVFLHWDVAASLGLMGGPTPEQLAEGKPPLHSAKEIQALEDAVDIACLTYNRIFALYVVAARGGEADKFAAAGYALSLAQARLAWVKEQPSATVARMEQAEKFAKLWLEAAQSAFDAETITLSDLLAAQSARTRSVVALDRCRNAILRLGYDLSDDSQQPRIDPAHPSINDCEIRKKSSDSSTRRKS